MLYEYILKNYKTQEPIFFSDIEIHGVTRSAISQQMKKLCDDNKIIKYDTNIYYLPKVSKLNRSSGINADMVARYKYISRKGKIEGFYAGNLLANQMGISTQIPHKVEIVSNNIGAKVRDIQIGKRVFTVRRSCVLVDENNVYVLQLLELLKNLESYMECSYHESRIKIENYIEVYGITKDMVDKYIRYYPISVYKYYYEMRLDDVFAHRG